MKQFNLQEYLENPTRKIVTRYGNRSVRIKCTDMKSKRPIVALITISDGTEFVNEYTTNGWHDLEEKYPDKYDLFFYDNNEDKSELNGFERAIKNIILNAEAFDNSDRGIRDLSKELLKLAEPEIDTIKNIPKWRKTHCEDSLDSYAINHKGYCIPLSELEKLPKE